LPGSTPSAHTRPSGSPRTLAHRPFGPSTSETSGVSHGCFVVAITTVPSMRTAGWSSTTTPTTLWPSPTSVEPSLRPKPRSVRAVVV